MKQTNDYPQITILSYCIFLFFVPLLQHKDNSFVQFHVKQGIALFLLEILILAISFHPVANVLLLFFCLFLSGAGIFAVMQKKETPLPVLAWIVQKFNI